MIGAGLVVVAIGIALIVLEPTPEAEEAEQHEIREKRSRLLRGGLGAALAHGADHRLAP